MSNIDAVKSVQKEIPGMSQLTNNQALQVAKSMQTTEGMKTEGINCWLRIILPDTKKNCSRP